VKDQDLNEDHGKKFSSLPICTVKCRAKVVLVGLKSLSVAWNKVMSKVNLDEISSSYTDVRNDSDVDTLLVGYSNAVAINTARDLENTTRDHRGSQDTTGNLDEMDETIVCDYVNLR